MAEPATPVVLPLISFDTTLADLYAIDAKSAGNPRIALHPCGWMSTISLGSDYPRVLLLPMQDFLIDFPDPALFPSQMRDMMKMGFLNLIVQRDSFAAGKMDTIFVTFDEDRSTPARSRVEVEKTLNYVHPSQRTSPIYISRPQDLQALLQERGIDALAPKLPFDDLYNLNLICDVEMFYFLNTKAAIAMSGLPTPKSIIIQMGPQGFDPMKCCSHCAVDPTAVLIPGACVGSRRQWMDRQIARASTKIKERELPFVLKLQMSMAGRGTYIVTTEAERTALIEKISTYVLPKTLSSLIPANAHLHPANLILMDYISDIVGNWGVTFFVTQTGQSIFLGASEQRLKDKVQWKGSVIDFAVQEELKVKFTPVMNKMGAFLHSYGYYGPVGADVLESPNLRDGMAASDFYVVDLNVRVSGSLNLVLLKNHLFEQRGLRHAISFFVKSDHDRDHLISKFQRQFEEGRIIITAWYCSEGVGTGGAVIIAGEDLDTMNRTVDEFFKDVDEIGLD